MEKKFKTQDDYNIENAIGTLKQLIFFASLKEAGTHPEACVKILADNLSLSETEALRLLHCIGRSRNYSEPIPLDLKNYLIEKGRSLLK